MFSVIVALLSCACMIYLVFFLPSVRIGRFDINIYWAAPLLGALVLFFTGHVSPSAISTAFLAESDVNPLHILVLFLSMTLISVFLDSTGFFSALAASAVRKAGNSQKKLFLILYLMVSVLTVFTSNDIVVLTFTPFICYFAYSTKVDPMPYLIGEFVAANTWSMLLEIGNPTNIYLAGSAGVNFLAYVQVMLIPTLLAGVASLGAVYCVFRRKLTAPIQNHSSESVKMDRPMMLLGLVHLCVCIVMMAISSWIGVQMWIVSLVCFCSLYLLALLFSLVMHRPIRKVLIPLAMGPYQVVPFILSMFVIVLSLEQAGITAQLANFLNQGNDVLYYGISSFFAANVVNNIPMSVLFSGIIGANGTLSVPALYASIAGSNIGAYLTPIGALAGIMWMGLLKTHGLPFSFGRFVRQCAPVALVAMSAAMIGLALVL